MGPMWRPVSAPRGPPQVKGGELGCCVGDCPLAQPRVPGGCLSPKRPDPVRSRALKMAASAGPGTAAPWAGGAPCPGARAGGSQGCCASTAQGTPLASPHPVAVSSRFPHRPGPHSQLPVPSREIINGVMVTDRDNNELGHSRRAAAKGIAQVVVSRITMAAPGMISPRRKREGGPAPQVVFGLISLLEPSWHCHQSPLSPQPSSSQHTARGGHGELPQQLGPTRTPLALSGPGPSPRSPASPRPHATLAVPQARQEGREHKKHGPCWPGDG
ncbi:sideroflexin-2 isoform 7-T9 [Morphnus guianensis]